MHMDSQDIYPRKAPRSIARDDRGAAAIEYAFLVALIAIAILGALGTLGQKSADQMNRVDEAVGGAAGTSYST